MVERCCSGRMRKPHQRCVINTHLSISNSSSVQLERYITKYSAVQPRATDRNPVIHSRISDRLRRRKTPSSVWPPAHTNYYLCYFVFYLCKKEYIWNQFVFVFALYVDGSYWQTIKSSINKLNKNRAIKYNCIISNFKVK